MTARTNAPTVLVLGVGGNVSQGILKSIAAGALPCRVVAACITPIGRGPIRGGPQLRVASR